MRKILSLITAFVLCTSFVSAKTIYCKMEQSWWKVDNAAVGCHYWGTPGPGTDWPGVRMTPVEGETDLWSIDLDLEKVQNVIFTRVSPLGTSFSDWGAKTKDLQIPTDDKNLFTITTSKAVWGDPGCEGEWSVYGGAVEKPKHDYTITVYLPAFCDDIAAYADSARVMGGFDDWSNGIYMQKIVDEDFNDCWVAEIKDVEEGTEFKLRFGTDADWKVQVQLNGANMANEAFGETTDIVLHYDGEGYGFAACAAPAARKEFVFVAGEAADSDPAMFAITWGKDGSSEQVKMEKEKEALYAADILATVDSVVLVRCATGATEIIWDGEGKNVWNQTANYALCDTMYFGEWTEEGLFTLTCEAPKPVETKYYAKNNWDGAKDEEGRDKWTWLEMSATNKENIYMLDSVVFGGTGVNINDKEDDTDALWFAADAITVLDDLDGLPGPIPPEPRKRDTIPYAPAHSGIVLEAPTLLAGDTIKLFFNAADSTLKAFIIGRPQPECEPGYAIMVNGERHMLSLNAEQQDYTEYWIDSLELKVNDEIVLFDTCAATTFKVAVKGYEGFEPVGESDTLRVTEDAYYQFYLKLIYGADELYVVKLEEPIEHKFYVTGNAALVGEEKAWQADAIEMVDYTHTFPMLAAGEYQLKVTDGTWEHSWGYDNLSPTVAVEGLYTDVDGNICFTVYTPNDVTVTFAQGYVVVTGDFTNPTPATPDFGLLVNGTDYLPGTPEDKDTYTEYAVNTQLAIGEFVQLFDNVNKAAWTVTPEGSGFTDFEMKNDAYYIKQAGSYQFYIKIPKEGMESGLYVGFQGSGTNLNKVKAAQGQRFNVLGLPVNANYRGVVIMNGQTYLQ